MRILSWNLGNGVRSTEVLQAMTDVDVALLQEVRRDPSGGSVELVSAEDGWSTAGWERRSFCTAVARCSDRPGLEVRPVPELVRLGDGGEGAEHRVAVSRPGTIALATVSSTEIEPFLVASVYSAWERPVPPMKDDWTYADASAHRLISDLSALVTTKRGPRVLVAGDWNILHGYGENGNGYWRDRYATVFERMEAIGFAFQGPQQPDGLAADPPKEELPADSLDVPTYRWRQGDPATANRQLDFVFATPWLAEEISSVAAWNNDDPAHPHAWGPSDHCRLMVDLH